MSALLVGESVCKYFGGLKAVDDVSFNWTTARSWV